MAWRGGIVSQIEYAIALSALFVLSCATLQTYVDDDQRNRHIVRSFIRNAILDIVMVLVIWLAIFLMFGMTGH